MNIKNKISINKLLDEGLKAEQNIDKELEEYFSQHIANDTFISWVAIENNEISGK